MSRANAVQTSRDRLAANMIVAIPAAAALFMIWLYQKPKAESVEGWGSSAPHLPL